jgi:hypothetical protein
LAGKRHGARIEGRTVGKVDEVSGGGLGDDRFGTGQSAGAAGGNGSGMAPRRVGKGGIGDDVLVEENDAVFFIARPVLVRAEALGLEIPAGLLEIHDALRLGSSIGLFCHLVAFPVDPNCESGLFPIALSNFFLLLDTGACRNRKGLGDCDVGLDERGVWDELVIGWDCHVQGIDEFRVVVIEVRQRVEPAVRTHHQQTQRDTALEGGLEDVVHGRAGEIVEAVIAGTTKRHKLLVREPGASSEKLLVGASLGF